MQHPRRITRITLAALLASPGLLPLATLSANAQERTFATPEAAAEDPDFALQGEYSGTVTTDSGDIKIGVQVVALGQGKFQAVGFVGGLPGDGWNGESQHGVEATKASDGTVTFISPDGLLRAVLAETKVTVSTGDGTKLGTLSRIERKSPTLGAKPPENAIILFDGTSGDAFEGARLTDDGLLMQGVTTKRKFDKPHHVHVEFRLPYQPDARGQGRGNSGIYLQGRHEVQMLDSFGLTGEHNECGGLYSVKKPDVNMCYPPLAWQTYDIDFTPATFDAAGAKTSKARITVRHNGVVIHDNVELPGSSTAAPVGDGADAGPLYLQDHGNPVRYRNIWVVEAPAKGE